LEQRAASTLLVEKSLWQRRWKQ